MARKLLILWSLLFTTILYAQREVLWQKNIGGKNSEFLNQVIATPDYGFLIVGSSTSADQGKDKKENQGGLDYFIGKMDENGKEEWQQTFGGSSMDNLHNVVVSADGGYLLVGASNSPISGDKDSENIGNEDIWILKLNPELKIEWQKTIGGIGNDIPVAVIQTRDRGYLIGAVSNSPIGPSKSSPNLGGNDYWVIKLDNKGQIEWEKTYGGAQNDNLKAVAELETGYILLGNSSSFGLANNNNFSGNWNIIVNRKGDPIRELSFSNRENSFIAFQEFNKEYLIFIQEKEQREVLKLMQLKNDFNNYTTAEYPINPELFICSIYKTNKEFIVSSNKISINEVENSDFLTSAYVCQSWNLEGGENWSATFGSKGYNYLNNTLFTRDESLILYGNATKSRNEPSDFYLIKLGLNEFDEENLDKNLERVLIEAYPNPTNNYVNILINDDFKQASIKVYNLLGQHLQTQKVLYRTTPISLYNYPRGTYILEIQYDQKKQSIKIIKN